MVNSRRRKLTAVIVAVVVGLAILIPIGFYLVSPIWIRTSLIEPMPASTGAPSAESIAASAGRAATAAGGAPEISTAPLVGKGEFRGADDFHFGRGRALIAELAPGRYALRLKELSVRNGPDLFVYLSTNPTGYSSDSINLGRLKATDGAFNYDVPDGTDISKIRSVVIWCRQFATLFATAPLT